MTKRLYIIGNGFDRYHGINSSYYDFRDWMRDNICYDGEEIESLFECDDLWKSFEENLALLRYDVLAREKTEENPPNVASEHFENTLSDARCEVENLLEGWYEEVRKALPRWVRQLNRPNPDVRLMLNDKDSVFLTFNYTRTLEDLYGISDDVVLHVHGKDGDPWDGLLLGHGGNVSREHLEKPFHKVTKEDLEEGNVPDPNLELAESDAIQAGYHMVMKWAKPVHDKIAEFSEFFKDLSSVEEVFVLGLSFSMVDQAYITEVVNSVGSNAGWSISYYSEKDKKTIAELCQAYHLKSVNLFQLRPGMKIG